MSDKSIIWEYVQSCAARASVYSDCNPVWEFGAISTFLVLAVVTLLILVSVRLREESRLAIH